jgi:hypothetical protein
MHLNVHSDVFAYAESTTRPENGDEIIHLNESSGVLDLLFQYMCRQPQPNLQLLEFTVLLELGEATEKYMIYSAMPAIMIQIKCVCHISHLFYRSQFERKPSAPARTSDLRSKGRDDHRELGNAAARLSVGLPMSEAATILNRDNFVKWVGRI